MEKLPSMGTEIMKVLMPTIHAFVPELQKNKSTILSIPRVEYIYGSHPRQKLDMYTAVSSPSTSPILIFLYGGGLVQGDKIVPPQLVPDSLVYHNLGSFFAQRGYTTIIPDYRRANTSTTGEDAVYPSGGEDLALALRWLEKHLAETGSEQRDVFIMGNSAGAVHIATYLLDGRWKEDRLAAIGGSALGRLKGAILLSIPADFEAAREDRLPALTGYYGSAEGLKNLCPTGLLKSASDGTENQKELGIPDVLAITADLDPIDEIIQPSEGFVGLWKKNWKSGLEYEVIAKHNHISPPYALGTGDEEGEKWGIDVLKWMNGKRV